MKMCFWECVISQFVCRNIQLKNQRKKTLCYILLVGKTWRIFILFIKGIKRDLKPTKSSFNAHINRIAINLALHFYLRYEFHFLNCCFWGCWISIRYRHQYYYYDFNSYYHSICICINVYIEVHAMCEECVIKIVWG